MRLFSLFLMFTLVATAADRDLQTLNDYRLSLPVLHKLGKVKDALLVARANDPLQRALAQKRQELNTLEQKDELSEREQQRAATLAEEIAQLDEKANPGINLNDAESLSDIEAQIQALPTLTAALRTAGFSTREYATVMFVLVQTGFAYGLIKSGLTTQTPANVSSHNLNFFREHEAEIAAAMGDQGRGDDEN